MTTRPPERVRAALTEIADDPQMNDALLAMVERSAEFETPLAARLAGVALNTNARQYFDETLDQTWADANVPNESPEIVIGGGLHAAIYSAIRVRMGHPKPLVIEASPRAGGSFAVSRNATFYLNSRNRPGKLGIPGREEALNFIPGAPVQPSDLSGDEYQSNASLAFSIRATLAVYARVLTGRRVVKANSTSVTLDDGRQIKTTRVIYATGLGEPDLPDKADGKHLVSYPEFMAMLDQPFPLRGLDRVAVVGAGDSGRTVIEALTGQGPTSRLTVASLDWIERIDWYGVEPRCLGRKEWESNNRSRYKGIGRLLPMTYEDGEPIRGTGRVTPIPRRVEQTAVGFDGAYLDGARYDLVIWAGGFKPTDISNTVEYRSGGRVVARMGESNVFTVGPAAQLPQEPEANAVSNDIPENTVALFRYADRTAAFAMGLPQYLPAPDPVTEEPEAAVDVPYVGEPF